MKSQLEKHTDLIRALTNCLITHPDKLTLDRKEHHGAVYWSITPAGDDYPMISGKRGANIDSLAFLVQLLGNRRGNLYILKLEEPHPGARKGFVQAQLKREYDPREASVLLTELLGEYFAAEFAVDVSQAFSVPLCFTFAITPHGRPDYEMLHDDETGITMLAALQTLFTAYGNREGVKFRIDSPK